MEIGGQIPYYSATLQVCEFRIMWIYVAGICGKGYSFTRGHPPHGGGANFANYRTSDLEVTQRSADIIPFPCSVIRKLQSMYVASTHGDAHLKERNNTTHRPVNLHEGRPAAFSVCFMVDTWNCMVSDYNES